MLAAGCPGGPFLEPAELADDPAIASRGLLGPVAGGGRAPGAFLPGRSPASSRSRDGRRSRRSTPGALPLSGMRVVDLTWVAAGPVRDGAAGLPRRRGGARRVARHSRPLPAQHVRPVSGSRFVHPLHGSQSGQGIGRRRPQERRGTRAGAADGASRPTCSWRTTAPAYAIASACPTMALLGAQPGTRDRGALRLRHRRRSTPTVPATPRSSMPKAALAP